MEKKDLKTGMVVETRIGERYLVVKCVGINGKYEDLLVNQTGFTTLCLYEDNLLTKINSDFDIAKIYTQRVGSLIENMNSGNCLDLIWERKEKPQLTERELAYLKAYSYDYEWVARDADGDLYIYENQPIKDNYHEQYNDQDGKYINISDISGVILSFIKWEDEEPYNIKELLGE